VRILDIAQRALQDIDGIQLWQSQHGSGPAAQRRMHAILDAIRALRHHPCRYPKGEHPGTRVLTVERYVVVYEVKPDTGRNDTAGDVIVLRVFGPGQLRNVL